MGIKLQPKDYEALSPADYAQWVDSLVLANSQKRHAPSLQPETDAERLLVAILTDLLDQYYRQLKDPRVHVAVVLKRTKKTLAARERMDSGTGRHLYSQIAVSRYGFADWDAVLTAALQVVAAIVSEDPKRGKLYRRAAKKLGVAPEPVEFIFREPVGSATVLKTPYGDLPVIFGKTMLATADGERGGRVIAASLTHVELEQRQGVVHRLRAEEVHPDSGKLDCLVPSSKLVAYQYQVDFGKSSLERNGKTFYALEQISGTILSALAADGERCFVTADELTL